VIARAPGKLVISGAYSVLEGAPCLVAAVDRYVLADGDRPATYEAAEVRAAVAAGALSRPVWYDASALREGTDGHSRKLGLGSSAAILVASLAAGMGGRFADEAALRAAIFPIALAAHRVAQGGGSGVDVAASVFGGVLCAQRFPDGGDGGLTVTPHPLPPGTVIEVYGSPVSASTPELLGKVRGLRESAPTRHRACLEVAGAAAREAVAATTVAALVRAVAVQTDALGALGDASGAPIVTPEVAALRASAEAEGGTFAPSGAGGGDIAFFLGPAAPSAAFRAQAAEMGLAHVALVVGAPGAGIVPA
jgi:phosphomevalonate kinase